MHYRGGSTKAHRCCQLRFETLPPEARRKGISFPLFFFFFFHSFFNDLSIHFKIVFKISGDGRLVGKQVHHVLLTLTCCNDLANALRPDRQLTLALVVGKESRELLVLTLEGVNDDLKKLRGGLDLVDGRFVFHEGEDSAHHPVQLIFCSDWKFAALVYGINAACADYFCLWCKLRKMDRGKLVVSAEHRHVADWRNGPSDGMVQEPLLDAIDFVDIFIDLLHLFLRVVDVLLACLFTEILKTVGGGRSFFSPPPPPLLR